jgi:hypothetical protein
LRTKEAYEILLSRKQNDYYDDICCDTCLYLFILWICDIIFFFIEIIRVIICRGRFEFDSLICYVFFFRWNDDINIFDGAIRKSSSPDDPIDVPIDVLWRLGMRPRTVSRPDGGLDLQDSLVIMVTYALIYAESGTCTFARDIGLGTILSDP